MRKKLRQAEFFPNEQKATPMRTVKDFKVVALRETALPADMALCDTPDAAADYWDIRVESDVRFNPEVENMVVLFVNARRRVMGHQVLSQGTMDTLLVHPREVFRAACIMSAHAIILMHNHPSGESTPSDADIRVTRDLIRAGKVMKIEVLDHVVMGRDQRTSLREMGYFYES